MTSSENKVPVLAQWVTYLRANVRNTLWPWFELGHRRTSFRAGKVNDETPNGNTGQRVRNERDKVILTMLI